MSMKSYKLAGASFAVTSFLLIATFQNTSAAKLVDEKTSRTFQCRKLDEYKLVVVENPNRKKYYESRIPEDLNTQLKRLKAIFAGGLVFIFGQEESPDLSAPRLF